MTRLHPGTPESDRYHANVDETGEALALAAIERGDTLTEPQRDALRWNIRFGSDSYPVQKCGRKWALAHAAFTKSPLYRTKFEATRAWEILLAKWRRMAKAERGKGTS